MLLQICPKRRTADILFWFCICVMVMALSVLGALKFDKPKIGLRRRIATSENPP
jgi:hypothetical protein